MKIGPFPRPGTMCRCLSVHFEVFWISKSGRNAYYLFFLVLPQEKPLRLGWEALQAISLEKGERKSGDREMVSRLMQGFDSWQRIVSEEFKSVLVPRRSHRRRDFSQYHPVLSKRPTNLETTAIPGRNRRTCLLKVLCFPKPLNTKKLWKMVIIRA